MQPKVPFYILPLLVVAELFCTSLWFSGNVVLGDLIDVYKISETALGPMTSSVQFGFICGTALFAVLTFADRFPPSRVFFLCAVAGAICNLGILLPANTYVTLLTLRFLVGFFLAGIYPVAMKIAADYYEKGLGKSLGFLVGALVLGTALPHLIKGYFNTLPWAFVLSLTSTLAVVGGLLVLLFVPNGPYKKLGARLQFDAIGSIFISRKFTAAAFGYFGHMWELYAFWVFLPSILTAYNALHPTTLLNVPLWSFIIIGVGAFGCVFSGMLSTYFDVRKTALAALLCSGICCLLAPLFFEASETVLLVFLIFWGIVVIADSPLFSTLVAQHATPSLKGTSLTLVNCIGFAITIVSIQIINYFSAFFGLQYLFMVLALGPLFGLLSQRFLK